MKKIFAFAIAIVAMATSMVSCNNDNTDFIEQPNPNQAVNTTVKKTVEDPVVEGSVSFDLPVTDVQLEMMDIAIRYTIGGKTYTVTTDEMEKGRIADPKADLQGVGTGILLTYNVPGTFTIDELKDATVECVIQRKEEGIAKYKDQLINVYTGLICNVKMNYGLQTAGKTDLLGDVNISDPANEDYLFDTLQFLGGKIKILRH